MVIYRGGGVLAFAAMVEAGTGLALLIAPVLVVGLLMGTVEPGVGIAIARFLGIALLALGVACWPAKRHGERGSTVVSGMLIYNTLVALFLAFLYMVEHMRGVLLWPAVVLHAVVALLLFRYRKQSV